eukprot:TRINITY_DN2517_c0_g1_i1.p1 TRINITY_DN2517_c0_g1~~TRINITY_DN2517_c0_g1_i1.p1  ORF type:complete len:235 (+),score=36.52 TRINITY_DN2517_c0_g1_i1:80-784(+)
MSKVALKRRNVATVSGTDIAESIAKRMKSDDPSAPLSVTTKVRLAPAKAAANRNVGQTSRYQVKRCPLRWLGLSQVTGPIKDVREHLMDVHHFQTRRHLPKEKRFCTASGLSSEGKAWGQIVTLPGGRQLAYVVAFQPDISTTHGFVSVFTLDQTAPPLGSVTAIISAVKDAENTGMKSAQFTWSEVPHMSSDLEQVAGMFPIKLFTSRLAEGKPHERVVEVTIKLDETTTAPN